MPTTTPNLSLTLWDPVADTNQTFLNFRTALAGPTDSNMTKIDTAIGLKAPIDSPTFTGTPTVPTAATGTSTTQIATTAFVNSEIANDAAPIAHVGSTGSSHGVATTSVHGFMSSTDKTKLDGVATGANNYTHPTTDGSLHVPVAGTTNNGKVLKAGATEGSLSWGTLNASDVGLGSVTNQSKATMFTDPLFTGSTASFTTNLLTMNSQTATIETRRIQPNWQWGMNGNPFYMEFVEDVAGNYAQIIVEDDEEGGGGARAFIKLKQGYDAVEVSNLSCASGWLMAMGGQFTGTLTAPTKSANTSSTEVATTAFVKSQFVKGTTTIPTTGWIANAGDNTLKCNIAITGVAVGDWVDVTIDKDYQDTASAIQLNGTVDEYAGGITIYANSAPTVAIPIRYMVVK